MSSLDAELASKGMVGRGVWISRFPYLVLPVPAPFLSGSRLCVLLLLQNIVQCCEIHFLFLPTHRRAPLGIPFPALSSPASRTLPAPITPRFPHPCPPPLKGQNVPYLCIFMSKSDFGEWDATIQKRLVPRLHRSELRGASISRTNPMSQPLRVSFYF